MTRQQLIANVRKQLTWAGSLPYTLPDDAISQEIDIAMDFFYDNWRYALEPRYLLLPRDIFMSPLFLKNNRNINLPECVEFVDDCRLANSNGSLFGTIDPDFGDNKFIGSEIFLTPFIGESLMYRTIMLSFLDLTKAFSLDTVAYQFNKNTKNITILGKTPRIEVVLRCQTKISEENLFNDEFFRRWVYAKTKIRLVEFLTAFGFQLPGGVAINFTLLTQQAQDEWRAVQEQWKGEEGSSAAAHMLLVHF